jgi:putative transposase
MPRKPIIRSNQHYYHLYARSNNKEFFELPLSTVWAIMIGKLDKLQKEFDLKILAFVLMNNHFHLLMISPKEDIDKVMFFFMKDTTKAMQKHSLRINKIYGGRYKGCLIENYRYLMSAYKYIYQNPLRAGLAQRAEDYEFSTLNLGTLKNLSLQIEEIIPPTLQSSGKTLEYRWINEGFSLNEIKSIKTGLSRTKFKFEKDRNKNQEIVPNNPFIN